MQKNPPPPPLSCALGYRLDSISYSGCFFGSVISIGGLFTSPQDGPGFYEELLVLELKLQFFRHRENTDDALLFTICRRGDCQNGLKDTLLFRGRVGKFRKTESSRERVLNPLCIVPSLSIEFNTRLILLLNHQFNFFYSLSFTFNFINKFFSFLSSS